MIDNWEDKLWEIAERYNTSKPVSGDWSTETEHELNAIAEELGITRASAKYLMISRLGFDEDRFKGINTIDSSRQIKSARYIATDPESGEVLGSADTYEEAVNEWGEDVTITDSEATEEEQEQQSGLFNSNKTIKSSISAAALEEQLDGQFWTRTEDFEDEVNDAGWDVEDVNDEYATISNDNGSQYEVRFYDHGEGRSFTMESFKCIYCDEDDEDDEDDEIESSNQLNGDKAFLSNIVSSVLTQCMTQEQAVKRIALRNNCNQAFARNILSSAMEDESLISSGTMELASDLNQDFNVDGDFYSWTKDYMPDNGKASTVGGEILRAANQIIHRYQNDGDRINVGNGKETVNPAARYLVDKCVGWTGSSEIEDMLSGANDTNSSDEYYSEWVDDLQVEIEDYLRNHEELFHTANQDDMWDYKTSEDDNVEITSIFIEDDNGNRYSFQGGPEGWHCYDIYYANKPKFNVGDVVSGDEIGNPTDEYTTFEDNGFMYSAEKVEVGDDWEITDVQLEGELVHKDEEWTTDELERYQIYNAENESEISVEDLY